MNQGDAGTSMYIVADGHVNIHLPGEASRRISLKDITRGEYFGEIALFDDKPRSASALATTDATLLELDRETLSKYLDAAAARRDDCCSARSSTRLRETNEMLSQRAAKNAVQEIESKLTWSQKLADKVAELNGSWAFILFLLGDHGRVGGRSTPNRSTRRSSTPIRISSSTSRSRSSSACRAR